MQLRLSTSNIAEFCSFYVLRCDFCAPCTLITTLTFPSCKSARSLMLQCHGDVVRGYCMVWASPLFLVEYVPCRYSINCPPALSFLPLHPLFAPSKSSHSPVSANTTTTPCR